MTGTSYWTNLSSHHTDAVEIFGDVKITGSYLLLRMSHRFLFAIALPS